MTAYGALEVTETTVNVGAKPGHVREISAACSSMLEHQSGTQQVVAGL